MVVGLEARVRGAGLRVDGCCGALLSGAHLRDEFVDVDRELRLLREGLELFDAHLAQPVLASPQDLERLLHVRVVVWLLLRLEEAVPHPAPHARARQAAALHARSPFRWIRGEGEGGW